jgi:hypothetical protein
LIDPATLDIIYANEEMLKIMKSDKVIEAGNKQGKGSTSEEKVKL